MSIRAPGDAHHQFVQAFNAGDLNALVSLYEPGAVLVPQPGQIAKGKEAIRGALQAFLVGSRPSG